MNDGKQVLASHSAAAPAAGFCYQFHRALYALCQGHNGDSVGIETIDDVVIFEKDGKLVLEQDKHSLTETGKVFGDKTHNLLHTLAIWLSAVIHGEIDPGKTTFHLVTNVKCDDGLARDISEAITPAAAASCLEKIRSLNSKSAGWKELLSLLSEQGGEDAFKKICVATRLTDAASSDLEVMNALPIEEPLQQHRRAIYLSLLGWLQDGALQAWRAKQMFVVSYQVFFNELTAVKNSLIRSKRRERAADKIFVSREDMEKNRSSTFVRQIELVAGEDCEDIKDEAIGDYVRCMQEKFRLSASGDIAEQDWIDFDSSLRERWEAWASRTKRMMKQRSPEEIGMQIMEDVLDPDYRAKLAGEDTTHPYITRGSYQRLSNCKDIGWHPHYKELLDGAE